MADNPRIADLRKKLEKDPASRLFAQLAEELRKEGELQEAVSVARDGLSKHPNYPSARMTLGRALYSLGDMGAARSEFEAVLKAAPDNILAGRMLGDALWEMGDPQAAKAAYQRTLKFSPGDKAIEEKLASLAGGASAPAPSGTVPRPQPIAPVASPQSIRPSQGTSQFARPTPSAPTAAPAPPPAPARPMGTSSFSRPAPAKPTSQFRRPFWSTPPSPLPVPKTSPEPATASEPAVSAAASTLSLPVVAPRSIESSAPAADPPTVPSVAPAPGPEAPAAPPANVTATADDALDRDFAVGTMRPGAFDASSVAAAFETMAANTSEISRVAASAEAPVSMSEILSAPQAVDDLQGVSPATVAPDVKLVSQETAPGVAAEETGGTSGPMTVPLASVTLADLYVQQGLKKEAAKVLRQVLAQEPGNAVAATKLQELTGEGVVASQRRDVVSELKQWLLAVERVRQELGSLKLEA